MNSNKNSTHVSKQKNIKGHLARIENKLNREPNTIVIIGHSAAGKSALLEKYGIDRRLYDMDKIFLEKKIHPDFSMTLDWINKVDTPKIVCLSNLAKILDEISEKKDLFSNTHFLYLKRSKQTILKNLEKTNTDGLVHPNIANFDNYYDSMNVRYEKIADTVVNYNGNSINKLINMVTSAINKIDMNIFLNQKVERWNKLFLTKEKFDFQIKQYAEKYPKDSHWNTNRWAYHSIAVDILKEHGAKKVLELGTMGIKLFEDSDDMDYDVGVGWRIEKPTFIHDAKEIPWPIQNKEYDFFVALRVFHHLTPLQDKCFQEARRIAKNIIIVTPENYQETKLNSKGIKENDVIDWNMGKEPTRVVDSRHGVLYFWDKKALKY